MKWLLTTALILGVLTSFGHATDKHSEDYKAVHNAILDYVEGVYQVQPERIKKSVHPTLVKLGYYKNREGKWQTTAMTFQQLHDLAGKWNAKGDRANENSPKEITIYEVQDKTASAKLVAAWGQDYFQLAKVDGKWMIMHVLWQSLPK